jgi:hypothetical protein
LSRREGRNDEQGWKTANGLRTDAVSLCEGLNDAIDLVLLGSRWDRQPHYCFGPPPLLGHFLARRRFVEERWWERRADAYITLLHALYDMVIFDEAEAEHLSHVNELSEPRRSELISTRRKAWCEIDRAVRVGRLMMSQDSYNAILKVLECHAGIPEEDSFSRVDAEGAAVEKCMVELSFAASRDLGVNVGLRGV